MWTEKNSNTPLTAAAINWQLLARFAGCNVQDVHDVPLKSAGVVAKRDRNMEPPSKTQIEPKLFHVSFMGTHCGLEFSGYLKEVIDRIPIGFTIEQVLMKRGPREQEIRFYVLEEVPNPRYEEELARYQTAVAEEEHLARLAEELRKLNKLQASLGDEIAKIEWQMKGNKS